MEEESLASEFPNSITMKMSAKGERYWDIKLRFGTEDGNKAIDELERIDKELMKRFKK